MPSAWDIGARVRAPMTAQPSSLARERVRGMEWQAWMGRCSSAPALALLTTGDSGAELRPQHSTPAAPRKYAARIAAPRFCCAPTAPAVSGDVGGAPLLNITGMQAERYQRNTGHRTYNIDSHTGSNRNCKECLAWHLATTSVHPAGKTWSKQHKQSHRVANLIKRQPHRQLCWRCM